MTQRELKEVIQRLPSGGIMTDSNRYDDAYIIALMNTYRGLVLKTVYQKDKRINPVCYQKYYPRYESDLQDTACHVKFRMPEVICMDEHSDGLRFMGSIDGDVSFRRVHSRAKLAIYNSHKIMNVNNKRAISVLYDGNDQILEVYGNKDLKEMMVEGIFVNPNDIPTYNALLDQYPFSEDYVPLLQNMILREVTSVAEGKPSTILNNDGVDGGVRAPKK